MACTLVERSGLGGSLQGQTLQAVHPKQLDHQPPFCPTFFSVLVACFLFKSFYMKIQRGNKCAVL